jgi:peroxiredoxin
MSRIFATVTLCSTMTLGIAIGARPAIAQSAVPMETAPAEHTPAPAVGSEAPDFTAGWGDSAGIKATPLVLREMRGRVVVLAFYPGDRTGGCTVEMTRFRDDYTTLFGSDDVVLLPTSVDSVESHVAWAKEMHFPFSLVSDLGAKVAALYGSVTPGKSHANRTVFVIGKDGKITYENLRFNASDDNDYKALAAAVQQAAGRVTDTMPSPPPTNP